jgi:hypothetical protein
MKSKLAIRLLAPLALVLAVAAPAGAQEPALEKLGFLCELDLTGIKKPPGVPASVFKSHYTLSSRKHCPSGKPGPNRGITIECLAKITGWPAGKASNNKNHPCKFNGDQCGVPGFITTTGTLNIDSSGNARLFCKR